MTGPTDARTKQYVDERLGEATFGRDRIKYEDTLLYLLRLLVEQRQMVLAERWHNRLFHLKDRVMLLPPIKRLEAKKLISVTERLNWENERFIGAIRNDPDPTLVFEHWFAAMLWP